jgi:NNP family nitrate/nitrite transporter-like MFS transporter
MDAKRSGSAGALALATGAFLVCFASWGLLSPLAPYFRDLYRLSATQVGLLVAVPVLLGSVARIPLGILTDRYGGRLVFTLLMLAAVVPLALAGLTTTYESLLAVSFFLGLAGASFAVGVPFVARWYPPSSQGFALGIYGVGNAGTALAGVVAPRVGRDAPGRVAASGSLGERFSVFRREPVSLVLALFYFVTFGGFVALGAYLPTLLVGEYGLARVDAAGRTAGFIAMATLARPIGGYLADRIGGTAILNGVFAVVSLLAVVLSFQPGMTVITIAFLGIALCLGLGNGAVFKLVSSYFPRQTGTVTGLVGAAGGLGGFFPPLLMGAVRDTTGSYAIGFMLLSEFALVCLIVNLLALQRRAANIAPGSPA